MEGVDGTPSEVRLAVGAAGAGAKHLLELVRRRDLQLIVLAVHRPLVRTPSQEYSGMPEAVALHVVVLHLADTLDPQRLPGQIFAGAPSTLPARHTRGGCGVRLRPVTPRMVLQRAIAERLELFRQ